MPQKHTCTVTFVYVVTVETIYIPNGNFMICLRIYYTFYLKFISKNMAENTVYFIVSMATVINSMSLITASSRH